MFSFNPSITPQPLPVDDVFGGGGTDGAVPGDAAGGASSFHTQFRGALERLEVHWGRDGGGGTLTSHRGGACP